MQFAAVLNHNVNVCIFFTVLGDPCETVVPPHKGAATHRLRTANLEGWVALEERTSGGQILSPHSSSSLLPAATGPAALLHRAMITTGPENGAKLSRMEAMSQKSSLNRLLPAPAVCHHCCLEVRCHPQAVCLNIWVPAGGPFVEFFGGRAHWRKYITGSLERGFELL